MKLLDKASQEQLRSEQRAWIASRDSAISAAATQEDKNRALLRETNKRIQKLQSASNMSEKTQGNFKDYGFEEGMFPKGGVRTIYQDIAWDSSNVIADAFFGPFRAVTIKGSNRIFIFDRRSRLLFGSIEAGRGPLAENDPPALLAFTASGRFLYSESQGHKTTAYQLSYLPALIPALVGTCYKQEPIGPVHDRDGRIGVYEPTDFEEQSSINESRPYNFQSVADMLSQGDNETSVLETFAREYPSIAQRVGLFRRSNASMASSGRGMAVTKGLEVSIDGALSDAYSKLDASGIFNDRQSYQVLTMQIRNEEIVLLEDVDCRETWTTIKPKVLTKENGRRLPLFFVRNPVVESNLHGYGGGSVAGNSISSGPLVCELDPVKFMNGPATLKEISGVFECRVPPVPDPEASGRLDWQGRRNTMFQMAFYYPWPQPLIVAYWMYPDKIVTDYAMGVFNPSNGIWIYTQENNRSGRSASEVSRHCYGDQSDGLWVSTGNEIKQLDIKSGRVLESYDIGKSFETFAVSKDLIAGMPRMDERRLEIWKRKPLQKQAELVWDANDRLVALSDSTEYATRDKSIKSIAVGTTQGVYPFEQFDLRLNRPDIVLERLGAPVDAVALAKQLRDKRLKRMGVTDEMLKPDFHVPELEIVGEVPSTTDSDEVRLSTKASDSKYPLERLKVFVNNVPVNGRDGESLRDQNTQSLDRTIPIKLAAGRNKIQVSVLNNAGAESLYANAEVNCTAKRPEPTLYAVAMGVSDYSNPDWNLKYAAKDAKDVLAKLKAGSGDNYGKVEQLLLTDKEVTKESIAKIKDFLSGATIDDAVLMFVAGHGLLDSNYDYYFGTTDIDFNNPADKGIAFEEFDDLLADLPALKKSLLIDTCHAGELDEEEKTLLASAGGVPAALPTANGVAVRSIGTRGMNVKAVEGARGASEWYDRLQGLFVDLRRGSGSTILSSSAGAEYALESSEQQNGLFTYAVLEALDGKKEADTNKDGSVQMSELGEYVKKRVSELTNNKQTPNTRRVNLEGDFTLAKTK